MSRPRATSPLVAWRGPSVFDGSPVRVIVYTLEGSKNGKLGSVVQVMFAPDEVAPNIAVKSGGDSAVCGDCPHRPQLLGTCYVVPNLPIVVPWHETADRPADLVAACRAIATSGLPLRIGAWGDPAAVPFKVVAALARAATHGKSRHAGYTRQWRSCDQRFRDLLMASVISPKERAEAHQLGWRTFRIRAPAMPVLRGEAMCPASPEAGKKTTCSKCVACSGANGQRDVVVVAHGSNNKLEKLKRHLRILANDAEDRSPDAQDGR